MSTLEIRAPGALSSIQDAGRRGYRRIGVPPGQARWHRN